MRRFASKSALGAVAAAALFGASQPGCQPRTRIVVPPEAMREWAYQPREPGSSRHVLRMSDGTRDWEVEFPDVAMGYEVRIPLRGAPGDGQLEPPSRLTAADRELLEEHELGAAAGGGKEPADAERSIKALPAEIEPAVAQKGAPGRPKSSYLAGIARVRDLYRTRNYEVALIDCVELERQYPNNEKLLAMKGSIYRKLGKPKLARETWEKVLALNPDNQTVADALRELAESEGDRR